MDRIPLGENANSTQRDRVQTQNLLHFIIFILHTILVKHYSFVVKKNALNAKILLIH